MITNLPDDEFVKIMNADLYMHGQRMCKNGERHHAGMSEDEARGYSDQYALEQALNYLTRNV